MEVSSGATRAYSVGVEEGFQLVDPATGELIPASGTGAQLQRAALEETGSLRGVVDRLVGPPRPFSDTTAGGGRGTVRSRYTWHRGKGPRGSTP